MSDTQIEVACYAVTALAAIALLLLRNPSSFLSRLVDRIDENHTDRKALR